MTIHSLCINAILQASHINDIEGDPGAATFDTVAQSSIDTLMAGNSSLTLFDETAQCMPAFRVIKVRATPALCSFWGL